MTEDAGEIDTTATNTEVPKTFDRVIAENPTDAIAENPMIVMVMVVVDEEGVVVMLPPSDLELPPLGVMTDVTRFPMVVPSAQAAYFAFYPRAHLARRHDRLRRLP